MSSQKVKTTSNRIAAHMAKKRSFSNETSEKLYRFPKISQSEVQQNDFLPFNENIADR